MTLPTRAGIVLAAMMTSASAFASDLPSRAPAPAPAPTPAVAEWKFQATVYGWLTALNGDVGARYKQPVSVDMSFADVLDHLQGVFMGAFEARNDTWMVLIDVVWSKLGASHTTRYGGQLDFSQTLGLAEGYVGYRLPVGGPALDVRGLVGVRGQRLSAKATHFGVLPVFDRSFTGSVEWADPVIGLAVHYDIDKRWFVDAIGDIGGFGVGSKLTSQGFAAVGYRWTDTISTSLGYRALYTDYDKGGTVYKTTMHGVFVGLGVSF
jgi:hypothetical protein